MWDTCNAVSDALCAWPCAGPSTGACSGSQRPKVTSSVEDCRKALAGSSAAQSPISHIALAASANPWTLHAGAPAHDRRVKDVQYCQTYVKVKSLQCKRLPLL